MGGFDPPTTFYTYNMYHIIYSDSHSWPQSARIRGFMERLILNIFELTFAVFCVTMTAYQLGRLNSKSSVYNDE